MRFASQALFFVPQLSTAEAKSAFCSVTSTTFPLTSASWTIRSLFSLCRAARFFSAVSARELAAVTAVLALSRSAVRVFRASSDFLSDAESASWSVLRLSCDDDSSPCAVFKEACSSLRVLCSADSFVCESCNSFNDPSAFVDVVRNSASFFSAFSRLELASPWFCRSVSISID